MKQTKYMLILEIVVLFFFPASYKSFKNMGLFPWKKHVQRANKIEKMLEYTKETDIFWQMPITD